jgi:hypothetical protein
VRELLNQHSFVVLGALGLATAWFVLRRLGRWVKRLVVLALLAALAIGWTILRPGGGDIVAVAEVDAAVATGTPVVLQFFSNY